MTDIVTWPETTLLCATEFLAFRDISRRIPILLDLVFSTLADQGAWQNGPVHLVYEIREGGTWIACGVQVKGEVRLTDGLAWVLLPAAETAQALHIGNYGGLPEAHQKLDAWIVEEGRQAKGLSWEVYGDWVDNETQLQTWVYKALAE